MTKEEIFYESAKAQSEEQDVRRQHFDTMAVSIIGFAAVLVGFTSFTVGHWSWLSTYFFVLMLFTFIAVAAFALLENVAVLAGDEETLNRTLDRILSGQNGRSLEQFRVLLP